MPYAMSVIVLSLIHISVILLGGATGRDGCGGATGSSKSHTLESINACGAEVQKGNPLEERKIQRLFRNKEVTNLIKRCNDFGAGGVSVAVGELADGLDIDLNKVPKKYDGLDGTELAISESQERMAVVVAEKDADKFIKLAAEENLSANVIAKVTDTNRLVMKWNGVEIVNCLLYTSRYHSNQGLILLLAEIAYGIVYGILSSIILAISWRLYFLVSIVGIVGIVFTVLSILGIINAAQGRAKELPIIGKYKLLK